MQSFSAIVVDVQTQEPLPFASIYVQPSTSHHSPSGTISNAVGGFAIKCAPTDVLRVSFVGYKTLNIQAAKLQGHVALEPLENKLKEVTVKPIDLKKFIRKTTAETRRQLDKYEKRKSCFFYRQITFADSTCYELMEAFLQAKPAVFLRDLFLMKGRFAGIQPDSLHRYSFWTNFYTVSEMPMLTRYDYHNNTDAKPLTRNYKDFYDLDYDLMGDSTGRLVAVHFIPKKNVTYPVLAVTLYIDENTYHLRKMEGEARNVSVCHKDYIVEQKDTVKIVKEVKTYDKANFLLTVNMTEDRGFLEVQSVYIDQQFQRYGKQIATRSILFNVGDLEADKGMRVWSWGDMHSYIRQQGYDPVFWHNNETVLRTPIEEQVMQLFEQQNLFGVMAPEGTSVEEDENK